MREADALWDVCAKILKSQVSDAVWLTSFSSALPVDLTETSLTLSVPSSIVKERIEGRYLSLVRTAMDEAGARGIELVITIDTQDYDGDFGDRLFGSDELLAPQSPQVQQASDPQEPSRDGVVDNTPQTSGSRIAPDVAAEPRYTFEAFVIGSSNRFAHAAALSVAERPGRSYNPLFIHGHAGLGKTHLLQAIAHYVRSVYPAYTVRYVTTENFLNEFVDAIRTNSPNEFKRRYREIDVLLLDDIQFIEGREGLQEELFHTFNHLHEADRQIVLSSDRPPDNMATLEDRLRSRFKMGLITDIQPPDFETRLAIVRKKAERETHLIPPEVSEFIASNVKDNIRELEGALTRITAFSSLNNEPLTAELAEQVLRDLVGDKQQRRITPKIILEATSEMFDLSIDELIGRSRRKPLVTARQIAMYVFRETTDLSFPAIAREFGGRDHTTVIHAVDKISALMKERREIYDQVTELTAAVRGGSGV